MSHKILVLGIMMSSCLTMACSNDSQEEPDDDVMDEASIELNNQIYVSCSIPDKKAYKVACSAIGSKPVICAVNYVMECDSNICGIYNGSDSFCTYRCLPSRKECTTDVGCTKKDLDMAATSYVEKCPGKAACVEWISGTAAYYCLPRNISTQ